MTAKDQSAEREALPQSPSPLVEALEAFDARLSQWAMAYPLSVFPEPDYTRSHEVLTAAGMTLSLVSAGNMRHVVTKLNELFEPVRAALSAREAPAQAADYEEVLSDHQRLVRELDVLLNGEAGAAKQASLCDVVAQVRCEGIRSAPAREGWQPIETAPRDGSHVHLYAPELQFFGFYAVGGWCYVAPGVPLAPTQPTHWRESPKPPVAPTTEGSEK